MPNLLVIQHVETMYLGGNNVRLCVREFEETQDVCIQRSLATGSRDWQVAKVAHV